MIPRTLEESLNGGYPGLYGEVVTCDMYHLRQVTFQPDVIFDIGANVGVFSRFARELFPKAHIVAVEPHPQNLEVFKQFTHDSNLSLVEAALGRGPVFRATTAVNGAHECYLSAGLGYPLEVMENAVRNGLGLEASMVPVVTVRDLVWRFWKPTMKALMKIDCEGGENAIWDDPPSLVALSLMDYLCLELHDYAISGNEVEKVREVTTQVLCWLAQTHDCQRDGVYFWATRR